MDRRRFLHASSTLAALAAAGCAPSLAGSGPAPRANAVADDVDELQRRTFDWFVHTQHPTTGLTPDRWPTPSFASVAAVGFALTCWPVGVERGWISREEATERTLRTIRFLHEAPQGPEPTVCTGHMGFFYHFIDMETGHRFGRTELSTVDTALLMGGMLFAARYFDRDIPAEAEIRRRTQAINERIDWPWVMPRTDLISMGWHPETGFIASDWHVYNEAMLVLLLALGSPTHPVPPSVWDKWTSVYPQSWTDAYGPAYLHFAPLFGHQYSHMFIDFRGVQDRWMRESPLPPRGFDYFKNSQLAVEAQRTYAQRNPGGWTGYSRELWGLTACDGPGDFTQASGGRTREYFSYSARGPGDRDDGTLSPTAALGAFPFAPEAVTACFRTMKARYGEALYTEYGFLDSFNPTLTERREPLQHGRIVPGIGWVDGDYLGIDQGPIVIQIENHRSDLVWSRMRGEPTLTRGLRRAGFTGGWLDA